MADNVNTNDILLPTSRIDVFAFSEETQRIFEDLKNDWRFARVTLDVGISDIEAAIAKYSEYGSPDLVIIGTDDISESFIDKLGELAGHCDSGTEAVVIGPKNDVQLYRRLVGMGVRDYLVRPIQKEDMVGVLSKALFEKMGISESRLVAVIGAKGGVGVTSLAQNIAWLAAENLKQKTILMDAAGGWSTLSVALGVEPSNGLTECIRTAVEGGDEDLERMYSKMGEHLTLFACGGDDVLHYAVNGDMYERAVNRIMKTFPVVVVDLSCAPSDVRYRVIDRAHEVVVVSTPTLTSLRLARTLLNEIKLRRSAAKEVVNLILNKKGQFGSKEINDKDIVTALDHTPQANVPYLPDVFNESESSGRPAVDVKGGHAVSDSLLDLVSGISGGAMPAKDSAEKNGVFEKLFSGLKKKG